MLSTHRTEITYAQALAFCGNSFLDTVHHTGDLGLRQEFWARFPRFDDQRVAEAVFDLKSFAGGVVDGPDAATSTSVEFTRLFVGPPQPAAPPWETFYRNGNERQDGKSVGFGEATFQMQTLLQESGLKINNANNQYADHIGIELLLASVYAEQIVDGDSDAMKKLTRFVTQHPLSWIMPFSDAIAASVPNGYYSRMAKLAEALLRLPLENF